MDPDAIDGVGRATHGGTAHEELLDFSANTNPEFPAGTRSAFEAAFDDSRRYPDDDYAEFRRAAAGFLDRFHDADCDPSNVIVSPGGLAAIRLVVAVTVGRGDTALVPAPSFAEYAREVRLQGGNPVFRPQEELLEADPTGHALAIVCTPNNPTGKLASQDRLRAFADRCRRAETTLLVDEAFLGFVDVPSIAGTDGVVVVRSLTKLFGLPGIRVGYAVASGDVRDRLRTARRPWNLSTPAARVGTHCLNADRRGSTFVADTRKQVERERERLRKRIVEARQYEFESPAPPTPAGPFLLLRVANDRSVEDIISTTRDRGVAVRDARSFRGLDAHVRVAVKDPESNDRMLNALHG